MLATAVKVLALPFVYIKLDKSNEVHSFAAA